VDARDRLRFLVLTSASVSPACTRAEELPGIAWAGEHVEVATFVDVDEEVCGATLNYLDQYAGLLRDRFGTHDDSPTLYYYLPDGVGPYFEECDGLGGCTDGTTIYATRMPQEHELVHASIGFFSYPVLGEGLAERWGGDAAPPAADAIPLSEIFKRADGGGRLDATDYETVLHFVSHLVATYGEQAVLEVARALDFFDDQGDLDRALQEQLGTDLDTVVSDYETNAEWCRAFHARDPSMSCALAERASCGDGTGHFLVVDADMRCESDGVIGTVHEDAVTRSFTFDVDVAGPHVFRTEALGEDPPVDFSEYGWVVLERCEAGCGHVVGGLFHDETYDLEPGRHRILAVRYNPMTDVNGFRVVINHGTPDNLVCDAN